MLGAGENPDDAYYRILVDRSKTEIIAKLEELKAAIEKRQLLPFEFGGLTALWFGRHLYQPLLYVQNKVVELSPQPLNKGEQQFVEDLKSFRDREQAFFAEKELYLLRNLSKGRGIGFFEAGNFHPDFILWLTYGGIQHIIFVDPKGIRNLAWIDEKIRFHETIKEIETRLSEPNVKLHSFIVFTAISRSDLSLDYRWRMLSAADPVRPLLCKAIHESYLPLRVAHHRRNACPRCNRFRPT